MQSKTRSADKTAKNGFLWTQKGKPARERMKEIEEGKERSVHAVKFMLQSKDR